MTVLLILGTTFLTTHSVHKEISTRYFVKRKRLANTLLQTVGANSERVLRIVTDQEHRSMNSIDAERCDFNRRRSRCRGGALSLGIGNPD
jgi:hypothetical protein